MLLLFSETCAHISRMEQLKTGEQDEDTDYWFTDRGLCDTLCLHVCC